LLTNVDKKGVGLVARCVADMARLPHSLSSQATLFLEFAQGGGDRLLSRLDGPAGEAPPFLFPLVVLDHEHLAVPVD
jgi:hypothetical protein